MDVRLTPVSFDHEESGGGGMVLIFSHRQSTTEKANDLPSARGERRKLNVMEGGVVRLSTGFLRRGWHEEERQEQPSCQDATESYFEPRGS